MAEIAEDIKMDTEDDVYFGYFNVHDSDKDGQIYFQIIICNFPYFVPVYYVGDKKFLLLTRSQNPISKLALQKSNV